MLLRDCVKLGDCVADGEPELVCELVGERDGVCEDVAITLAVPLGDCVRVAD